MLGMDTAFQVALSRVARKSPEVVARELAALDPIPRGDIIHVACRLSEPIIAVRRASERSAGLDRASPGPESKDSSRQREVTRRSDVLKSAGRKARNAALELPTPPTRSEGFLSTRLLTAVNRPACLALTHHVAPRLPCQTAKPAVIKSGWAALFGCRAVCCDAPRSLSLPVFARMIRVRSSPPQADSAARPSRRSSSEWEEWRGPERLSSN